MEEEEEQDFSNVKGSEVDVFRDTVLRYLGECFIYCNKIVMTNFMPLFLEDYLVLSSMEDKNPWNSYGKPCFHILNLSNNQM